MVLVWVRQDDGVESSIPGRDPAVEIDEQTTRVRTAVDEDAAATRTLDEDRVTLSHIENGDPRCPGRSMNDHRGGHRDRR
ncbi:MAG: hypothetical protein WKF56_01340, partial [Candidatus Limnocylindrales bacterium]